MKKLICSLFCLFIVFISFAISDKKVKTLDHYYLDDNNMVCSADFASVEIKVISEADSIKVYAWDQNGRPLSVDTYRVLNDSIQDKWGTQLLFWEGLETLRVHQFIDKKNDTDHVKVYNVKGILEKETFVDRINGISIVAKWDPNGKKQSYSTTKISPEGVSELTSSIWYESGALKTSQTMINGKSTEYTLYEEDGTIAFQLPVKDGDSIYINNKGEACTKDLSVFRGVVHLENDSIKLSIYNKQGRLHCLQNFMNFTPTGAVAWGSQHYYYTDDAHENQKVDSLYQFKAVNGENLVEKKYYPNGKVLSVQKLTYNNVMLPVVELQQYDPNGVLRRYQKKLADNLIEGHMYDSEGKETFPFYEFKEQ